MFKKSGFNAIILSKLKVSILTISALAFSASCATSNTTLVSSAKSEVIATVATSPNDSRQYRAIRLSNELEVVMISDPESDKSAAALSVGVGLLSDPMSQQGMAHYLEHMLFLGTDRYPGTDEYSKFMSSNGGASNAYTWMDITNYQFNINNAAYDEALDRFSDFFKSPKLYPEYTAKEIKAVNAEWSMRREADFFGQFKLKRQLLGDHPANRFLIGNLETLGDKEDSKLHPETVDFYNQYYSSNIMRVALLSNLSLDDMEKLAIKHFGNIKNKHIKKPTVTTKLDLEKIASKRIYYVPNKESKNLILDFTITNNMQNFAVKPNYFINYLLSSEMPGTAAFVLREQGLISSLTSHSSPNLYGNYGNLTISISLTDAGMKKRELIVATVMQYLSIIREKGIDEKYYKEIKTSLDNRFRFLEKTSEFGYVTSLAGNMQDYPLANIINSSYHYEKFDAKAINKVLSQLTAKNLMVWYISKQEEVDQELHFYAGKYRLEDISKEEIASWSNKPESKLNLPDINRLLPENFDLYTDKDAKKDKPELAYDHKGVKIWQFPSKSFSGQPKGFMQIYINNPAAQTDIKAGVMLSLWASMYNLQQSVLATEASTAGMSLRLSTANGLNLNISGFTDKQAILLERAFDKIIVDVTEQNFSQAVDRYVRGIKNSAKQIAVSQAISKFRKVINSGNFEDDDLIAAAESLKADDLKSFMKNIMNNNQVRVFSYGNYAKTDIGNLATKINQLIPDDRSVADYTRTKGWLPVPGQTLVYQRDIQVDDVGVIDFYIHPEPGFKQKARAQILNTHYSRAAFNTLRTEEQLAYAVGSISSSIDDYSIFGLYIQTPVMNIAETQERFDKFNIEYVKLLNEITEEEFQKLKESILVTLNQKPKNLSEEVSPYITDWYRENFNFDSRQSLIDEVAKVTLTDIKSFFKETVGNKNAARISVQMRGKKFADKPFVNFENQKSIDDLAEFHKQTTHQD
ncbi:MAG: peptidase M16 [Gammaproteobacteria bacterium]|nr:MAG: peptidase M16 [Gammaproteobacteria bacterium]